MPPRGLAVVAAVLAIALPSAGALLYKLEAPKIHNLIAIELGDRSALAQRDANGKLLQTVALLHHTLPWDYLFIACYGSGLILGCLLATWTSWTSASRGLAFVGLGSAVVAVVCDIAEDLCLRYGTWWDFGGAVSTVKWAVLVPAAVIAAEGVILTFARARGNRPSKLAAINKDLKDVNVLATERGRSDDVASSAAASEPPEEPNVAAPPPAAPPAPAQHYAGTRWHAGYHVPDITEQSLARSTYPRIAICLSGGGVRSASFALGAIQAMRVKVLAAEYLISVSGGGYTSGALVQALATPDPPGPPRDILRDPQFALGPGSVEEDHIRRHSSYLASSPWQLAIALALLARGLLATLFLLFSPAVVIGIVTGAFYRAVPITPLLNLTVPPGRRSFVEFPTFRQPGLYSIGAVATIALLCWIVAVLIASYGSWTDRWSVFFQRGALGAAVLASLIGIGVVGIPTLTWLSVWLFTKLGGGTVITVAGPTATILLSYLATATSVLWKRRKSLIPASGSDGSAKSVKAQLPQSMLQLLMVMGILSLLAAVWLLILGVVTSTRASTTALATAGGVAAGWLILGGLVDETALSLHPFYRRRLASAFAVRAERTPGGIVPRAYLPDELTRLPEYGKVVPATGTFPRVIFAAAANLDDNDYTAPGLRAVSYTMSADWVGGPDVGWLKTSDAITACPPHLQRDLTVQAAVAISGAAFASAMGRASKWYETLLAVSGARLGSWLPHPDYVNRRKAAALQNNWTMPGMPHVRRFPYLLREVFNIHPFNERLLHVTDGGHYENLGLVEALRRRCTEIYVVDATGDPPPLATTFAEAIRLARDELGVEIEFVNENPLKLVAGGATALSPTDPLATLSLRRAEDSVVKARVVYPPESGLPPNNRTGLIVFAKATLYQTDLPYELLTYATRNTVFPHDSTADQWFDEGQFSMYKRLGYTIGKRAITP